MKPFLSVIIPVRNESKCMIHTLLDIDRYLSSVKFKKLAQRYNADKDAKGYEILVVDDGSKDNTVEVVKKFQSIIKNLKIIENQICYGRGFAVKRGMMKARGKIRLFTDAGNFTYIDNIEKIIPYFYGQGDDGEKYSIVIGSRNIHGAGIKKHWKILSRLGNGFVRFVAAPGIIDTGCGFQCFTDKAARSIFIRSMIDGSVFDREILAIAVFLHRYKIKEAFVKWTNNSADKMTLKTFFRILGGAIKVRINIWRGLYK